MLRTDKNIGFLCERCNQHVREIYFWDDGTYGLICKECKDEIENGGLRVPPKEE